MKEKRVLSTVDIARIVACAVVVAVIMIGGIYVIGYKNTKTLNSANKNLTTQEIKNKLKCNSGDDVVIDNNNGVAYCLHKTPNCPSSYPNVEGKKCYRIGCKDKGTYNSSTKECEYANPNYPCNKGYTYNSNIRKCLKEDMNAYDDQVGYVCPSGYYVYKAPTNGIPYCITYQYSSIKYYCPSGYAKAGDGPNAYCVNNQRKREYFKYTVSTSYICPSGYKKSGSGTHTECKKGSKHTSPKKYVDYVCPRGYTKAGAGTGTVCYKDKTVTTTTNILKTVNCPKGWGISNSNTGQCYKFSSSNPKPVIISYWCKSGYYKANGTCYKQVNPNSSKLTHTNTKKEYYNNVKYTERKYNQISIPKQNINVGQALLNTALKEEGNGHTKYTNWYGEADEWCAMFANWAMAHTSITGNANDCKNTGKGGSDKCIYKKLITENADSVWHYANWMAKNKRFYHSQYWANKMGTYKNGNEAYTPKPGDLVFFNGTYAGGGVYGGDPLNCRAQLGHIAIVKEVKNGNLYWIGGNQGSNSYTSSSVTINSCEIGAEKIVGYGTWPTNW